jgi:hypothetical protein
VTKFPAKTQNRIWMSLCAVVCLIAVVGDACAATKIQEAYLHYQAHRFKEATVAFDEYLVSNPRDANALYYDALCNQQLGNMPRAKSLYRLVVQASPGSQVATYAESILVKVDPSYHASSPSKSPQISQRTNNATSVSSPPVAASSIQGPDQASVYYRPNGKAMMVTVEINGHPIDMMLDTGAPSICIGRGELENIGVHPPDGSEHGR